MSDTFERVVKVLKEQDGLEDVEFTPEMTLEEAGLDSLATVEAVMACEDEFGIEIDPESNPKTVGEFVELVEFVVEFRGVLLRQGPRAQSRRRAPPQHDHPERH